MELTQAFVDDFRSRVKNGLATSIRRDTVKEALSLLNENERKLVLTKGVKLEELPSESAKLVRGILNVTKQYNADGSRFVTTGNGGSRRHAPDDFEYDLGNGQKTTKGSVAKRIADLQELEKRIDAKWLADNPKAEPLTTKEANESQEAKLRSMGLTEEQVAEAMASRKRKA